MKLTVGRASFTLPEHPLIQCEAPATKLNGWFWEVGDEAVNLNLYINCYTSLYTCNISLIHVIPIII